MAASEMYEPTVVGAIHLRFVDADVVPAKIHTHRTLLIMVTPVDVRSFDHLGECRDRLVGEPCVNWQEKTYYIWIMMTKQWIIRVRR